MELNYRIDSRIDFAENFTRDEYPIGEVRLN
jgi:hypothetical protein